ncbi:hypothetical protein QBC35DRAFT_484940, partial [Podospora australis]
MFPCLCLKHTYVLYYISGVFFCTTLYGYTCSILLTTRSHWHRDCGLRCQIVFFSSFFFFGGGGVSAARCLGL